MNIYHVDKLECPVSIFLMDGVVHEGVVFLSPFSPSHSGAQSPLELFNEAEPFLPLRKADGSFHLINKTVVSHVRFEPPTAEDWPLGHQLKVAMVFIGGEILKGVLTVQAPEGKNRLQDFLNSRRTFVQLACGGAHYLVNPLLASAITPL